MATTTKNAAETTEPPRGYPDLHDHIETLREKGLLVVIDREINKTTEMHPLVRWQFRGGIPEKDRKAFLFTNVVDGKGRKYDIPVLVCGVAGSREIYSIGIGSPLEDIEETWIRALNNPIPPNIVEIAPCHDIVYQGKDLLNGHGLDALPVPVSTPGFDAAPTTTSSHWITKHPVTGVQNLGNYRGMLKSPTRIGVNPAVELRAGAYEHWNQYKARGEPMPAAISLGGPPATSYTAVQKVPETLDELAVSGGLMGQPLNVVRAKTVDLLVPAESEIVIEGFINTECLEPEAPFGEYHGYMCLPEYNGFMDVTCITRRKDAVLTSWVSQLPPSESTCIKRPAYEAALMQFLRDTLGIKTSRGQPAIVRVVCHEPCTSLQKVQILQFRKGTLRSEIWRALTGTAALRQADGKWVIAIDEDIDPNDMDAVFWAMSYRCKPQKDVRILQDQDQGSGPRSMVETDDAAVLIDATLKEAFPPVSLPKREFMERAREIWEELDLPEITPQWPWYGYDLGQWNDDLERQAQLAVKDEHWQTGDWAAQHRRTDVGMNTEVRWLEEKIGVGETGMSNEDEDGDEPLWPHFG